MDKTKHNVKRYLDLGNGQGDGHKFASESQLKTPKNDTLYTSALGNEPTSKQVN